MKSLTFILLFAFLSSVATATPMQFFMDCIPESGEKIPAYIEKYRVIKTLLPPKGKRKAWDFKYSVEVTLKDGEVVEKAFTSAFNGDEDYNDFNLVASEEEQQRLNVSSASFQNDFEWASLLFDGSGFLSCSPSEEE